MAKSRKDSWEKYYNGNDGITVKVKIGAPYYQTEKATKSAGNLSIGTEVIYRDIFSQHIKSGGNNKIAFQFDLSGLVYYSSVDNFRKPGGVSGIGLKPKNFGIENKTFSSSTEYYNFLISALDNRLKNREIGGELYEYLLATLNLAKTGSANFIDIQKNDLPWGEITSYFGELAGALACLTNHCVGISKIIPNPLSCKIYFPDDSVPLYDYKLISTNAEYMISSKASKSSSNVVKPQFVINPLNSIVNDSKLQNLKRTLSYKILEVLANNQNRTGPFYAYQIINPELMTDTMISSILSVYKTNEDGEKIVPNYKIIEPFVNKLKNSQQLLQLKNEKDTNVGLIRFICEKEIEKWSKTSTINSHLKQIFQKYLDYTRVIYVKMSASITQNPSFSSFSGESESVKTINSLYLRSKNDTKTRVDDKMGFQIG